MMRVVFLLVILAAQQLFVYSLLQNARKNVKVCSICRHRWNMKPMALNGDQIVDEEQKLSSVAHSTRRSVNVVLSSVLFMALFAASPFGARSDDQEGTKTDKSFELCISKCVFAETRPPPVGSSNDRLEATKSRGEILRECRKSCAKTKEQLLLGEPKKKISQ